MSQSHSARRAELRALANGRASRRLAQETELYLAVAAELTPTPSIVLGVPGNRQRVVRVTRAGAGAMAGTRHTWADVTSRDAHGPTELLRQIGTRGVAPGSARPDTMRVTYADGRSVIAPANLRRPRAARVTQVQQATQESYADRVARFGADGPGE